MRSDPSYATFVCRLKKDDEQLRLELESGDCDMLHMAVGIAGEAGELLDAIKKRVIYRKQLDVANVIEELGDLEFFMEGLRQNLGITRDDTINANIAKLSARYQKLGYSNEAAQKRADKGGDNAN